MQTRSELGVSARPKPEAVVSQIKLLRATERAHEGNLDAALVLLSEIEPTLAGIHLRARIELQRGHTDNARALWNEILAKVPNHAGAKQGLRALDSAATRGTLWRQTRPVVALLAFAGAAVLAAGLGTKLRPMLASSVDAPAVVRSDAAGKPAREPLAPHTAATLDEPVPEPLASQLTVPTAGLPEIAWLEGVTVRREPDVQSYVFASGLFSDGARFAPQARERITALGRALEPHLDAIAIELVGHVDADTEHAGRRSPSNTELAIARASAVLGRLVRTTRFSADQLSLRAVVQQPGPFMDASGDPRNRTVELRVTLRTPPSASGFRSSLLARDRHSAVAGD